MPRRSHSVQHLRRIQAEYFTRRGGGQQVIVAYPPGLRIGPAFLFGQELPGQRVKEARRNFQSYRHGKDKLLAGGFRAFRQHKRGRHDIRRRVAGDAIVVQRVYQLTVAMAALTQETFPFTPIIDDS